MNSDKLFSSVGIIGTGRYGGALACGFAETKKLDAEVWLHDKEPDCASVRAIETGWHLAETLEEIVTRCDLLIIAVTDENALDVLRQINSLRGENLPWIVCVSSGLTIKDAAQALNSTQKFFRALPSILVRFGRGQIAVSLSEETNDGAERVARDLFEGIGEIFWIDETLIPVFRATAGTAPGLISYFLRYLTEDIEVENVDSELLQQFWLSGFKAAAEVLLEKEINAKTLTLLGANPNGAIKNALEVFTECQVPNALKSAARKALEVESKESLHEKGG